MIVNVNEFEYKNAKYTSLNIIVLSDVEKNKKITMLVKLRNTIIVKLTDNDYDEFKKENYNVVIEKLNH